MHDRFILSKSAFKSLVSIPSAKSKTFFPEKLIRKVKYYSYCRSILKVKVLAHPTSSSVCGEEGLGGHEQHLHLLGELVVGVLLDVGLQLLLQAAEDGAHVVPRGGVLTVEIHDALLEEPVLGLRVIA